MSRTLQPHCLISSGFWIYAVTDKCVRTDYPRPFILNLEALVSAPFSHSCTKMPKDAEDMLEAATGAAGALKSVHGVGFTVTKS